MGVIDNKGKLFGRVSIIDILIVLILIGAVGGAAYKYTKSKTESPFVKSDKIRVVFYSEECPEYAANSIVKGASVRDGVQGSSFGTIVDKKVDKSISWAQNIKGEIVASTRPGYVSVYLVVDGQGIYSENGLTIGGVEYYVGQSMDKLRAGKSEQRFNFKIHDIKKMD